MCKAASLAVCFPSPSFRAICIFLHVCKQLLREGANVLAGDGSSLPGISVRVAVGGKNQGESIIPRSMDCRNCDKATLWHSRMTPRGRCVTEGSWLPAARHSTNAQWCFSPIVDTGDTKGQLIPPNNSDLRVRCLRESCWALGKDNIQVLGQPILRCVFE